MLGHFVSATASSLDAVKDIAARFGKQDGYSLELHCAVAEKRVIESDARGTRIIFSENSYEMADQNLLGR